ncbi:hypothetical protein [Pseudomonas sp. PDM09]|uniref:hypothetical protein n=1 Tax=Pseudomonas sp. PDM09 TaxID=2769270 RepID=UPI00178316EE|nr:hypothetical protein [Pseudomonas sp. PDM09]MBD9566534.1 hypothetical protein [Pseudomonas sp. PDM09]
MTSETASDEEYPARKILVEDHELVIRAIVEEEWEASTNRGSPGIFQRPNTSVTRIDAIGLQAGIEVVKRDVERPGRPTRDVKGVGRISVEIIKAVGETPIPIRKPGPVIYLQVWEEKVKASETHQGNEHHAEIVPYSNKERTEEKSSVSLGYSRMLSKALHVYAVDPNGAVIGESLPDGIKLSENKAD